MDRQTYKQIERRLDAANYTVAELCREAKISRVSWYNWKRGDHAPNVATWRKIEKALRRLDV